MYSVARPTNLSLKFTLRSAFLSNRLVGLAEGRDKGTCFSGHVGTLRAGEIVIFESLNGFPVEPIKAIRFRYVLNVRRAVAANHIESSAFRPGFLSR